MNKDIERRLKELRLAVPSPELRAAVLSNARAAWRDKSEGLILHMQFRQILALAASFVLFIGVIVSLNKMEERRMCQSLNLSLEKSRMPSENIAFLKDIGLDPNYVSTVAGIQTSRQPKLKLVFDRLENELKM